MEIAEEDRRFGASDDQNDEYNEEETEHVICLIGPQWIEDEEELNEDTAERKDTSHDDARSRSGIDTLIRYLPRDLICSHGMLNRLLAEEVSS